MRYLFNFRIFLELSVSLSNSLSVSSYNTMNSQLGSPGLTMSFLAEPNSRIFFRKYRESWTKLSAWSTLCGMIPHLPVTGHLTANEVRWKTPEASIIMDVIRDMRTVWNCEIKIKVVTWSKHSFVRSFLWPVVSFIGLIVDLLMQICNLERKEHQIFRLYGVRDHCFQEHWSEQIISFQGRTRRWVLLLLFFRL